MPTSWTEAIPEILEEVEKWKPDSVLDIGIGFGKYGMLLRETLDVREERYRKEDWKVQIDGIEAFRGYQNPIHDYVYDHVFYSPVDSSIDLLPDYDVVLMIDVLEHFTKKEGKEVVRKIMRHTKKVFIISTPLYPAEQGEVLSNPYEEHKSRWTQLDFIEFDFDYKLIRVARNGAQLFILRPKVVPNIEFPVDKISFGSKKSNESPLTIAYFLPHTNLTGGVKMLLEQMKHLREKGHKIHAFRKGNEGDSVLPTWFDLEVDKEILVPSGETFLSHIQGYEDVGVAGWLDQMGELAGADIPVVYWEQGNEYLFGDVLDENTRAYLTYCYQQPVALTSVSPTVANSLLTRFGRNTPVIPNGIDTGFYRPGERPNENLILMVGNSNLLFKGFDVALQVLIRLWKSGQKFKVKWVCQVEPALAKLPLPFPIEYVIMPSQTELAACYRQADIFLFTSWYEGFGMPPLEAMASGLPVVSTACGGIDVYAKHKVNAMLAEPGDIEGLTNGIMTLLNNEKWRKTLSKAGRATALQFSSHRAIRQLENYLYNLVSYTKKTEM